MGKTLILSTVAFKRNAKNELKELFGDCKFDDLFEGNFVLTSQETNSESISKIKAKDPIFVHNAIPVDVYLENPKIEVLPQEIVDKFLKEDLLKKGQPFAIDTLTNKSPIKSRDLEVRVGSLLEEKGFSVDLKNPSQLIGVVVYDGKVYAGAAEVSTLLYPCIDLAKKFARESMKEDRLNRAQFKLVEAIGRFNLKLDGQGKYALDLGASPGGWSKVLASKGYEVISVDKGNLDESIVGNPKITHIQQTITPENVLTIKKEVKEIIGDKTLEIITNDMNLSPLESIELMNEFADYLHSGSTAVLTLKSVRRNIMDLIKEAKEKLEKNYEIVKAKHLEQNRREITLYIHKK